MPMWRPSRRSRLSTRRLACACRTSAARGSVIRCSGRYASRANASSINIPDLDAPAPTRFSLRYQEVEMKVFFLGLTALLMVPSVSHATKLTECANPSGSLRIKALRDDQGKRILPDAFLL